MNHIKFISIHLITFLLILMLLISIAIENAFETGFQQKRILSNGIFHTQGISSLQPDDLEA